MHNMHIMWHFVARWTNFQASFVKDIKSSRNVGLIVWSLALKKESFSLRCLLYYENFSWRFSYSLRTLHNYSWCVPYVHFVLVHIVHSFHYNVLNTQFDQQPLHRLHIIGSWVDNGLLLSRILRELDFCVKHSMCQASMLTSEPAEVMIHS